MEVVHEAGPASVGVETLTVPPASCRPHGEASPEVQDARECQRARLVAKSEMAGEFAHEINNHLAVLMGNIELIEMTLGPDMPEKLTRRLNAMQATLDRMKVFTECLLRCRHPLPETATIDINAFVKHQLGFLRPQKSVKKAVIKTDLQEDLPAVTGDPCGLQQVFHDVIVNAAEAVDEDNGAGCTVTVTTRFDPDEQRVILTIHDDGPGISGRIKPDLFRRQASTRSAVRGFSMLNAAQIMAEQNGMISARNHPDGGAEFCIALPVSSSSASHA